jgi:hypothetical protein
VRHATTALVINVTSNAVFRVTGTGTAPLTYQWRKGGVGLVGATGATLSLANVRTNQAGNYAVVIANAWGSITSSVAVLTVNRLVQAVTFADLPDKSVGDAPFTLRATASSGRPVSYTSSNPSVATVSGKTVTIQGTGSTTLTARQAGNATYLAAENVSRTLTVAGRNFGKFATGISPGGTDSGTNLTASATAPRVSLSMNNGITTERTNDVRSFLFTRRGGLGGDLVVNFSIGGTAVNGVDYQPINGSIVIPDGKATAAITFRPVHDLNTEPAKSVILKLTPSPNYSIGVASATATIRDHDVDTDREGVSDAQELLNGTNRLDPLSH